MSDRRKFKHTRAGDVEDIRTRRMDSLNSSRKSEREKTIFKRRKDEFDSIANEGNGSGGGGGGGGSSSTSATVSSLLAELPKLVAGMNDFSNPDYQYECTCKVRKLLSKEKSPPIERVVEENVVPLLVSFLDMYHHTGIQFEAAWALTNIASGNSTQTGIVVEAGAIPKFAELLNSENEEVKEQAVWALGNIAGDGTHYRDLVLRENVMGPLVNLIRLSDKITMVRNATWTLSNLCRGKNPPVNFALIEPALQVLAILLYVKDDETLTDACWALSYLTDSDNAQITRIVETGVLQRLIELLTHPNMTVATPALRAIGNIVTGDDNLTQRVLNLNVLQKLHALLNGARSNLKKEACWTVSNITAGDINQIQAVINANLVPALIHHLESGDTKTRKEAAWALANACSGGSKDQILFLAEKGCLNGLCALLDSPDNKLVLIILDAIEKILTHTNEQYGYRNPYVELIEGNDTLKVIESLQSHANDDIAAKSHSIITKFWSGEEDDTLAPTQVNGHYGFDTSNIGNQNFQL